MNIISNIINNTLITEKPLNIIVAPYDGVFEYSLASMTNNHFYLIPNAQKLIQPEIQDSKIHLLNINTLPIEIDFDLIICNEITSQVDLCFNLSKQFHIPLLIIHHSLKQDFVKKEDILILRERHLTDTTVVMHQLINKTWFAHFDVMPYHVPIIQHGINQHPITIIGTFNPTQLYFLEEIKKMTSLPITIIGNNQGVSHGKSLLECLEILNQTSIFLNLYNDLEINPLMLFAMGTGCTVISTDSPLNRELITHGENGYIFKDASELPKLLSAIPTGPKAQESMLKYNQQNFIQKWQQLLWSTSKKPFLG